MDARGYLVATVRDVDLEVPAPDPKSQAGSVIGVPAKILRIQMPRLEVALSYQVEESTPGSHRVRAKIEDFTPSPDSHVLAINDDESKATALNRFSGALVIRLWPHRLRSLPIVANLDHLNLRGFAIQSITPLDPSGMGTSHPGEGPDCRAGHDDGIRRRARSERRSSRPDLPRDHATGAALPGGNAASTKLHRCRAAGSRRRRQPCWCLEIL